MKQTKGMLAIIALLAVLAVLLQLTGAQKPTNRPVKGTAKKLRPTTIELSRAKWRSREAPPNQPREPQFVPNQVLVKLESREDTRVRLGLVNLNAARQKNERLRAEVTETVEATQITVAVNRSIDDC